MNSRLTLSATFVALLIFSVSADAKMINGEKLAKQQVFTYRILDDIKSLDPQINASVQGSELMRDVFEGLMN